MFLAVQRQRLDEGIAEADIGDPRLALKLYEQNQMIKFRAKLSVLVRHPAREQGHVISQLAQQGGEQAVELVTEPAAALAHDLVEESSFVQNDGPPEMDVQVFEWDRQHVAAVQPAQNIERRLARPIVADAFEIGGNVQGICNFKFVICNLRR